MNHGGLTGNYNSSNFLAGVGGVASTAEEQTDDFSTNVRSTPILRLKNRYENGTRPIHYASTSHLEPRKKLESFTCFPRLLPELRLKIWRTIAFMPRVVAIRKQARHDGNPRGQISIQTTNAAAKLLQINHESRVKGLRFYKPYFGAQLSGKISVDGAYYDTFIDFKELIIHVNLAVDTVYFDRFCFKYAALNWPERAFPSDYIDKFMEHASSIAIDVHRACKKDFMWSICTLLERSPSIKEVLLVVRIDDNLKSRTLSGHWDLLEFDEDEASGYREKYWGYWIKMYDALGSRLRSPRMIVLFSDPEIRIVGLTREGVRI